MTRLIAILLSISLLACKQKQELSTHHKLFLTAKVWGFLKYYHPVVNNGQLNWDNELIALMQKLPDVNNQEELSTLYINWIKSLGEIEPLKNNIHYNPDSSFNDNFNLSWVTNDYFTNDLTNLLHFIEQNRAQKLHYVTSGYVGQVEITNEPSHSASQWSDPNIRLITLFNYWNVIEYFYPYKYRMDKKWDDVLHSLIPKFLEVKTELEYHLLIRELTISLCDSHAFFTTDLIRTYAGNKFIAGKFSILNDKAIITGFGCCYLGS